MMSIRMTLGENYIEVRTNDHDSMVNVYVGNNRHDDNSGSIDLTPEQAAIIASMLNKATKGQ